MEKGDKLDYHISAKVHVMVITGVSFKEDKKPGKWKIKNKEIFKQGNIGCFK